MLRNKEDNDLRDEIYHLKKQLSAMSAENVLLKVKVRKLQSEVNRKDKQMDALFDPRIKSPYYEMSASFIMNLKEKNERLVKLLNEKYSIIKKLNSQLEVKKLYSSRPLKKINLQVPCFISQSNSSKRWTDLEEEPSTLIEDLEMDAETNKKHDIKEQYKSLPKEHLLSIIESLKNNQHQQRFSPRSSRKSSPESDLERIELLCESPHEEIKQLHLYFLDMLTEVDELRNTIARLENNQEKTDSVLKKKNNNIDKLAKEIKNLKNPGGTRNKPNRSKSASSSDLLVRIYSGGPGKNNKRNKANTKIMNENEVKDAFVQAEEGHKVYLRKGGIFITHTTCQTSKEDEDNFFGKNKYNEPKLDNDTVVPE